LDDTFTCVIDHSYPSTMNNGLAWPHGDGPEHHALVGCLENAKCRYHRRIHAERYGDLPGVAQAKIYRLIVYFADGEDVIHGSAILYG